MVHLSIFQYFGHREKLKSIGREDDVETLNRTALRIARTVADDNDKIMAAGICNTGVWDPDNEDTKIQARAMFKVLLTLIQTNSVSAYPSGAPEFTPGF